MQTTCAKTLLVLLNFELATRRFVAAVAAS